MGKDKFIDASLVKIREKLPSEPIPESLGDVPSSKNTTSALDSPLSRDFGKALVPDKEWKKALFARWDEYKSTRRDVMVRLKSRISRIPGESRKHEDAVEALGAADGRLRSIFDELERLDDSNWNRSNFATELGVAMKKVENARLECIVVETGINSESSSSAVSSLDAATGSGVAFIHELTSISFSQAFKLGLGFFFSLILAILSAATLLALLNYLTVN